MDDPRTPCRPAWCLDKAKAFLQGHDLFACASSRALGEERLANLLDRAYIRGRREERELADEPVRCVECEAEILRWRALGSVSDEPVRCVECEAEIPAGQGLGVSGPEEEWTDRSKPRPVTVVPLCLRCMNGRICREEKP
jgi:hypothetical protein